MKIMKSPGMKVHHFPAHPFLPPNSPPGPTFPLPSCACSPHRMSRPLPKHGRSVACGGRARTPNGKYDSPSPASPSPLSLLSAPPAVCPLISDLQALTHSRVMVHEPRRYQHRTCHATFQRCCLSGEFEYFGVGRTAGNKSQTAAHFLQVHRSLATTRDITASSIHLKHT